MSVVHFTSHQLTALYHELDLECAEFAREHGPVTAVQRNYIAARIMEAARDNPPSAGPCSIVIGPHGT